MFNSAAGIVFALIALSGAARSEFTGSLDLQSKGLEATGGWGAGPASIQWTVSHVSETTWQYTYSLTVPAGKIGHVIIETSPLLKGDSFVAFSSSPMAKTNEVKKFSSLPDLHQDIYGVGSALYGKAAKVIITFETDAPPVWGDVYAQGSGEDAAADVAIWNSGFVKTPALDIDPIVPASDGTIANHILVPGHNGALCPLMALWGMGFLAGGGGSGSSAPGGGGGTSVTPPSAPEPTTLVGVGLAVVAIAGKIARRGRQNVCR